MSLIVSFLSWGYVDFSTESKNCWNFAYSGNPVKPSIALPLTTRITVGTLLIFIGMTNNTCKEVAIYANLSISNLTNFHFPLPSFAFFSKTGVNYLQGPHQLFIKYFLYVA